MIAVLSVVCKGSQKNAVSGDTLSLSFNNQAQPRVNVQASQAVFVCPSVRLQCSVRRPLENWELKGEEEEGGRRHEQHMVNITRESVYILLRICARPIRRQGASAAAGRLLSPAGQVIGTSHPSRHLLHRSLMQRACGQRLAGELPTAGDHCGGRY